MALIVRHLNADTTFLLTFTPPFAPRNRNHARHFPGTFTILIDPWLSGQSSILHPSFQLSSHTTEPSIKSLAELAHPPHLIIISQDKPDHCHRETLCSLPKDTPITILATPAAAKKIRAWMHFPPSAIHAMKPWHSKRPETVIRIPLAPYTSTGAPGELTIANLPAKHDMTKLHNAIAITYRPPSTLLTTQDGRIVDMTDMPMLRPPSTPRTHKPSLSRPRTSTEDRPTSLNPLGTRPHSPPASPPTSSHRALYRLNSRAHSTICRPRSREPDRALSVIYTPHGVPYPSVLAPYARAHLGPLNALPVTALFHCINVEQNPWFMGGRVAAGAPSGVESARELRAKHWISAHDEVKDNRGVATVWIKTQQFSLEEVERMLGQREGEGGEGRTRVHVLGVGEEMRIVA